MMNFNQSLDAIAGARPRYLGYPSGQQPGGLPPVWQPPQAATPPAQPPVATPPATTPPANTDTPIRPGNDALPPIGQGNWPNWGNWHHQWGQNQNGEQPWWNRWRDNQQPPPPAGQSPGLPPLGNRDLWQNIKHANFMDEPDGYSGQLYNQQMPAVRDGLRNWVQGGMTSAPPNIPWLTTQPNWQQYGYTPPAPAPSSALPPL